MCCTVVENASFVGVASSATLEGDRMSYAGASVRNVAISDVELAGTRLTSIEGERARDRIENTCANRHRHIVKGLEYLL